MAEDAFQEAIDLLTGEPTQKADPAPARASEPATEPAPVSSAPAPAGPAPTPEPASPAPAAAPPFDFDALSERISQGVVSGLTAAQQRQLEQYRLQQSQQQAGPPGVPEFDYEGALEDPQKLRAVVESAVNHGYRMADYTGQQRLTAQESRLQQLAGAALSSTQKDLAAWAEEKGFDKGTFNEIWQEVKRAFPPEQILQGNPQALFAAMVYQTGRDFPAPPAEKPGPGAPVSGRPEASSRVVLPPDLRRAAATAFQGLGVEDMTLTPEEARYLTEGEPN